MRGGMGGTIVAIASLDQFHAQPVWEISGQELASTATGVSPCVVVYCERKHDLADVLPRRQGVSIVRAFFIGRYGSKCWKTADCFL